MQDDDKTAASIRQQGPQELSKVSIRACLSRLTNTHTGNPMHITKLAANANLFFFAGYETTAHALTWTLFELAAFPDLQVATLTKRCQQSHTGSVESVSQSVPISPLVCTLVVKTPMDLLCI